MKLVDCNVWLALALSDHQHHAAAREWLKTENSIGGILFCRVTQQGLLRLLTTAAVLRLYGNPPLNNREAWDLYRQFLADDRIAFCPEPPGIDASWQRLALRDTASPKLWMDAYLAAFAMAGHHKIVTTDAAFSQFEGLDPLLLGSATPRP